MSPRLRADRLLVERGLFDSRAKAQAAIAAGRVSADGAPVRKPSEEIACDAALSAAPAHPFVSRGGVKLAAALDAFSQESIGGEQATSPWKGEVGAAEHDPETSANFSDKIMRSKEEIHRAIDSTESDRAPAPGGGHLTRPPPQPSLYQREGEESGLPSQAKTTPYVAAGLDVAGRVCLDVGASTGGFTQVLLERGARLVYAVDVGRGQLHPQLAADARVVSIEGTDIRALDPSEHDPEKLADFSDKIMRQNKEKENAIDSIRKHRALVLAEPPSLVTIDVSFISLKLVLPAALALAAPDCHLVALVKPQFEAGRAHLKKGIVREPQVRAAVCDDITAFMRSLGCTVEAVLPSPIEGGDGNREFLLVARRGAP